MSTVFLIIGVAILAYVFVPSFKAKVDAIYARIMG